MSGLGSLARRNAWAHRTSFAGTGLVLLLAAALLSVAGVLTESGLRAGAGDSGLLAALAGSFSGTVLLLAVLVVASTVSLALRGRQRDLALLRAVGATSAQVRTLVRREVVAVTLVAAPLGAVPGLALGHLLTPLLRDAGALTATGSLTLGPLPVVAAVLVLLPVAWLAGRLAVRETLRAAPTAAVRESAVEPRTIGTVRRVTAAGLGLLGLSVALGPTVVPGTVGSAGAATSAFLLVAAAALAGPLLVRAALERTTRLQTALGPAGGLALANARGFSRRLAGVVVPLALALTAGTVQTTVGRTVSEAAVTQLRDGVHADLVVEGPAGRTASPERLAGVRGSSTMTTIAARVRTDDDGPGFLSWESTTLRALQPGRSGLLVDPGVTRGSLAALQRPGTVAVSSDAAFESSAGLGGTVDLRWADGSTSRLRVVAVYDRGLGFGDYLVGTATPPADQAGAAPWTVLLDTAPGALAGVRAALAGTHLTAVTPSAYADEATTADAATQRLSTVLLLALLAFVLLAAANTLVTTTARRDAELRLLARTGATRRQLVHMALIESLVVGGLAWLAGSMAAVPAVLGVGLGMLGPSVPPVDLPTYAVLSVLTFALPVLTVVSTTARLARRG